MTSSSTPRPGQRCDADKMEGKVTKIWATVLLNRAYLAGMLVLNHSLRKAGTRYPLKVMLTSEAQTDIDFVAALRAADIGIITVDKVEAKRDGKVIKGMWQNLAAWKLTEYEVRPLAGRRLPLAE